MNCWKDIADIIHKLATSVGIIVAGIWTYIIFIRQRVGQPQIRIVQNVYKVVLPDDKYLLHVETKLENIGNILFCGKDAHIRMRQVLPLPEIVENDLIRQIDPVNENETEVEWPQINKRNWKWSKGEFEIEPGESDSIHAEFFVNNTIKVVQFYLYIANYRKLKKGIGWPHTLFFHLEETK